MVQQALPTRDAGLTRLAQFLPHAGHDYATGRNFDLGPDRHNVSGLSPWLRHRLVLEQEVVSAVLAKHSYAAAEKFIQEVLWRTYWKGWLEMRPRVWQDYVQQRDEQLDQLNPEQRAALQQAERGQTGIDCFDHWSQELVSTGYLHNHTRMWFASIWIFTLQLPWQLGADFFLRHLLDGDPASNTLSWRWVAGLHTVGKHYIATAANIRKFTKNRFDPEDQLNEQAEPLPLDANYNRQALVPAALPEPALPSTLLITEEDLYPESLPLAWSQITQVVLVRTTDRRSSRPVSAAVEQFVSQALDDVCQRIETQTAHRVTRLDGDSLAGWLQQQACRQLITAQIPVGPTRDGLNNAFTELASTGCRLAQVRRDWDDQLWPHATHGYFRFKKQIPALIKRLGEESL